MGCWGFDRAFQHPEVRIGWAPFVTTRECELRSNGKAGTLLKRVPRGAGVAWQSARNPSGSPTPPLRRAENGYAWVYTRAGTVTGWIPADALILDTEALSKPPLDGPGNFDFEIGRTPPLPKKPSGCGKPSLRRPIKTVKARDTYLRYSPRGTAFHYLHAGDKVRLLLVNGPHGFCFGEVVECVPGSQVKVGSRGWLLHEVLV